MRMSQTTISVGVLTVSDSCFQKKAEDKSGPNLCKLIEQGSLFHGAVKATALVADEMDDIVSILRQWCDELKLDIIFTTGGTGVAPRDVTPEATKKVIEKEAPGISVNMLQKSLAVTQTAMLSRPVCGIRGKTLIINFPGSKKASEECLQFVAPCLGHACDLLNERSPCVMKTHNAIQSECAKSKHADKSHGDHATRNDNSNSGCHHHHGTRHEAEHNRDRGRYDGPVSQRPRESEYSMLSMDEATEIVLDQATLMSSETVHFYEALNRILSDDVYCPSPFPPFQASIKDGYAVLSSDGAGVRTVLQVSTAGVLPRLETVKIGSCTRISTGAPVPNGADAVVQVEDTRLIEEENGEETEVEILKAPRRGQDIRPIGSDIPKDSLVLAKNTKLGASELALLASIGSIYIPCYKQPTVGILSTGDEIMQPDLAIPEGKIRDSNKTALIFTLKEQGFNSVDLGIVKDNAKDLYDRVAHSEVDVLITTGGVSMGEKDLIKPTLMKLGATIHFGRIFMKPGKPTTFATKEKRLFFSLPGNPVSAIVTCHLFVIPALRKMCGFLRPENTVVKAEIQNQIKLDSRPEYHRVTLDWSTAVPRATSTGNQGSCRLVSMKSATALLKLPPLTKDKSVVKPGEIFDAVIISRV